jgi:hypothetical protein
MREGGVIMRAPLLRLAIGLPIALLVAIAFCVFLLIQLRRPATQRVISYQETQHPSQRSLV